MTRPAAAERQRGIALLSVLWVVVILGLIAGSMLSSGLISRRLQHNEEWQTKSDAQLEVALNRAVLGLIDPQQDRRWPVDGRPIDFAFDGVRSKIALQDELGLIDLNAADATLITALLRTAGKLPDDQAEALTDKILDWRDSNSDSHRPHGAKADDYAAAGRHYAPRNGPYQSVEELRLVLGMTGALFDRIAPALTVYSQRGAVEPLTAPKSVLQALPGMDAGQIQAALDAREQQSGGRLPAYMPLDGRAFRMTVTSHIGERDAVAIVVFRVTDSAHGGFLVLAWKFV